MTQFYFSYLLCVQFSNCFLCETIACICNWQVQSSFSKSKMQFEAELTGKSGNFGSPSTSKNVVRSKSTPKNLSVQLPPQSPSWLESPLQSAAGDPFNSDPLSNSPITPASGKDKTKQEKQTCIDSASRVQIQNYLHLVSGQLKLPAIQELEHDYAKPCHIHPDPQIRAHAAKFLFMKNFPRHLNKSINRDDSELLDIISFDETKKIPFLTPRPASSLVTIDDDNPEIDSSITDSWTCEMNKLWTRATKIAYSDRVARLSFEGHANEVLLKRNLLEQTANKYRELFSSTFWDAKLVNWLHNTILEHLDQTYKSVYLNSLQILKHKIPALIETFYSVKVDSKTRPFSYDPLFNTLSHYKLKKLLRKPIFIIVPNCSGSSANQSARLKYWHSMFSSMGKVVTIPIITKGSDYVAEVLSEIRCLVIEKIRSVKNVFANRPIILVGFNYGSIIAAHCALQNSKALCATICLGFPLKAINGIRGDLDDPLLETSVPMQFIIGENAVMTSLDDMEDFRERITKTETSLIVVGGADDKLVVSNLKKRLECLTQSMVDRCVADEIFVFLSSVLYRFNEESLNAGPEVKPQIVANSIESSLNVKKTKKMSIKKRHLHDDELYIPPIGQGDANAEKLSKKKRPSKPKTLASEISEPNQMFGANLPAVSSILPMQPQFFSNFNSMYNPNTCLTPEVTALKKPKNFHKLENFVPKFEISDSLASKIMSVPSFPTPKKCQKKITGNVSASPSIPNLSPIKEEVSPIKNIPSMQMKSSPTLSALLKADVNQSLGELCGTKTTDPHQASQISSNASAVATMLATSTVSDLKNVSVASSSSFTEAQQSIHQSSTRTGRQIKPPKSLDF